MAYVPPPNSPETSSVGGASPEANSPQLRENIAGRVIWSTLFGGLFLALLFWCFLQVAYGYRSNVPLYSGGENSPLGVFSGLFKTDWSFSPQNTPPIPVLGSGLLLFMNLLLGSLLLQALDVRVSRVAHYALAGVVGYTVSGLCFELLIMAKGLYWLPAWGLWITLIGVAIALYRYREMNVTWRTWRKRDLLAGGAIPFLDTPGKVERGQIEPTGHSSNFFRESILARVFAGFMLAASAVFFVLACWHAWFYPETYWDSLILYLGYARMIFLEHKFPIKVTGQVGIGLGANYPHLYSLQGAVASTLFGGWSDFYLRFLPPLTMLASAVFVYQSLFVIYGRRFVASAAVLLLMSVPYGTVYFTAASSYCFAILYTAAFLYTAVLLARTQLPGVFVLLTFWPAAAMHVNYLMGILWIPWVVIVFLSFCKFRSSRVVIQSAQVIADAQTSNASLSLGDELYDRYPVLEAFDDRGELVPVDSVNPLEIKTIELVALNPPGPFAVFFTKTFLLTTVFMIAVGSSWYVRNWVITGNPVYAFFPEIFTGTKFYNPEVMESAKLEWFANGDGVFQAGQIFTQERFREEGLQESPTALDVSFSDRLRGSFLFFQGFDIRRQEGEGLADGTWGDRLYFLTLLGTRVPLQPEAIPPIVPAAYPHNPHAWKLAPLFLGFALPGLLIAFIVLLFRRGAIYADLQPLEYRSQVVGTVTAVSVLFLLLAYHFLLTDMYLYQIIPVIVPLSFLAGFVFLGGSSLRPVWSSLITLFSAIILFAGVLVPGLPFALMNFKVFQQGSIGTRTVNPHQLDHFRHPGMSASAVYTLQFGEDMEMWRRINKLSYGMPLLTHDNRHLMYDPSITLVHLDDWAIQQLWDASPEEKFAYFQERGIRYYLQIEEEYKHPINRRAGMDEMMDAGYLHHVEFFGLNRLMEFRTAGSVSSPDDDSSSSADGVPDELKADKILIEIEGVPNE